MAVDEDENSHLADANNDSVNNAKGGQKEDEKTPELEAEEKSDESSEEDDELVFINVDEKQQVYQQVSTHQSRQIKELLSNISDEDIERRLGLYRQSPISLSILSFQSYLHTVGLVGFQEHVRMNCYLEVSHASRYLQTMEQGEDRSFYHTLLRQRLAPPDEASEHFDSIEKDITRTNVHTSAFKSKDEANTALSNVLSAYALHDLEIGYCQGMNFLSGHFLTLASEKKAYWLIWTIMNSSRYNFRQLYTSDLNGLIIHKCIFQSLFQLYLPQLYMHFQLLDIHSDIFTEWFMTLFTFSHFPIQTKHRVWDLIITDGPKAIHRITLSILSLCADQLYELDFEGIIYYVKNLPDEGILSIDVLLKSYHEFPISNRLIKCLEKQFMKEMNFQKPIVIPKEKRRPARKSKKNIFSKLLGNN